jgi:phosphohistidine phosphatase SixA
MLSRQIAGFSMAAMLGFAALPALALAGEDDCNVDKLKSLSSVLSRYLRCSAKGVAAAELPAAACTTDADSRLASAFATAQSDPACAASGEVPAIQAAMHELEENLRAALVVTPGGRRCAAGKIRVATKSAKRELSCRRRAAAAGSPPDAACLAAAQGAITSGFAYREQHGTCDTTGDAGAVEALVADFLVFASAKIDGTYVEAAPSGLAAVVDGAAIELTWNASAGSPDLTHARVLRRLNSAVSGPTDGSAAVLFDGTGEQAADALTDLLPDTSGSPRVYHYAVYGCDSMGDCEATGSHTTLAPTVRQVLVAGGYVIHWRHAAADVCNDNQALGTADTTAYPDWWKRCDATCPSPPAMTTATTRQLNNTGRADATAIGDTFAALGITIGRVLTSEYCRNVETAQLMAFGPAIEESQELTYWVYDEASRCNDTFAMLGDTPTAGTNTALIGHAGNVCEPMSSLAWGEAAVYKPDGIGGTTFIARVLKDAWLGLP